jgi:uncharacterized damage-inducible protein DinB
MTSPDEGAATASRWSRATIFPDMWVDPDDDPRESGSETADERTTLVEYLRKYRLTLEMKCADLSAEQLACRSVPPSNLSLLGLVRHIADGERYWFREVLAGQDVGSVFWTEDDQDAAFNDARPDPGMVDEAWAVWHAEVEFAERFVAEAADLGITGWHEYGPRGREAVSLRSVLVHMIEEYARHCGHADLLRERVDGRVGQ